jgi:tRNA(fMet)-specific endonuclease VapC
VDQFVSRSTVLSISMTTAGIYAQLRLSLQRKGRPIPENDVWIAAVCMEHGLPLATRDAHFRHVEGLQVVRP